MLLQVSLPSDTHALLIVLGAVFVLIGLLGGGLEVSALKIPPVTKNVRLLAAVIGIAFLTVGIFPGLISKTPSNRGETAAELPKAPSPAQQKPAPAQPAPAQQEPAPAQPAPAQPAPIVVASPAAVMGPLEYGKAYLQADIYSKPSGSPEECATLCKNDVRCKAMTYIKSQRLCWIKNAVPAAASSPDMISAAKQTVTMIRPLPYRPGGLALTAVMGPLEYGKAYLQADIYSKPSGSPEECSTLCKNDVRCKAMTYIKSQRLCWIKNAVPAAASSPDM